MAEIQVSSWAEFLEAVQETDADVMLPENAVWDMNEIAPEGVDSLPGVVCANIYGNNTEIKNLHTSGVFALNTANVKTVSDLHFTNFMADYGVFQISHLGHVQFNRSKFSGICGTQSKGVIVCNDNQNASATRCSFVVDSESQSSFHAFNFNSLYCRFHIAVPNGVFKYPLTPKWSFFRIDQPLATHLPVSGAVACVFDGQGQAIVTASDVDHTYPSIFCADSMPNIPQTQYLLGVTRQQMRDPAYLASIGFPIGYDPPEEEG